jgi:hypothetical protein
VSEAEQGRRAPRSFTVGLARELYDKFVMGGWEPQDSYDLIEELLATEMTDDYDEKADLRAENARLRAEVESLRADLDGAAHNRFFDQRDAYFEGLKDA